MRRVFYWKLSAIESGSNGLQPLSGKTRRKRGKKENGKTERNGAGHLAALHGPRRIAAPLAPAARKQGRGRIARNFHGDQVGQGAYAAAALVDHGFGVVATQ